MNQKQQGYHKLIIYQKSRELVILIYKLTKKFPADEKYSLVPQVRRAAISIVANIVEGYSRDSKKDFARFLNISIGSAIELNLYLELCLDLDFLTREDFKKSANLLLEVRKMLYSFQSTMKGGFIKRSLE